MKPMLAACLAVTFLFLYGLLSVALPTRSVTLTLPSIASAPADITVRVTVEPADDQRVLRVVAEGENFSRASEIALEGSAGPRTSWIRWIGFPAGNYIITATVRNTVKVVAREVRQLMVVGF